MINKMLQLINRCKPVTYHNYRTEKSSFGDIKFIEANINIVYILNKKVYLGYGKITDTDDKIKREVKNIQNVSINNITYVSVHYVTSLESNEVDTFLDLLKYEQSVWSNIRISTSYAEWIKNDLPRQLAYVNEDAHWNYEVRGVDFVSDKKCISVSVCLDNCDVEEFVDYFIGEFSDEIVGDLSVIGSFDGFVDSCGCGFRCVEI